MIDIDRFKQINDTHGHAIGDRVIREIAALIRVHLRKDDILGRYGGEEFVAILPNTDHESAMNTMERIRAKCHALNVGDEVGYATISIGGSICDDSLSPPEALEEHIARADRALYRAKNTGRNRVVFDGDRPSPTDR
jgi:diguanylate cyclase (GGDEF)-like protein